MMDQVQQNKKCASTARHVHGFVVHFQGESRSDVTTLAAASRLDNIKSVFGAAVAKDLLPIKIMVR